jgi:peptidoglycan hydrolase-like protein with peptidoglycan-binding domain
MKTAFKRDIPALLWVSAVIVGVLAAFTVANAQTTSTVSTQMSAGDSGDQVSALQTFLAADSSVYPEGLVTGYYGDLTTAAVQRYQCKYGIVCQGDVASTGYGNVGPATLAEIEMQQGTSAGAGVSLPSIGFPTTSADISAPVISATSVATTFSSATINWSTNEPSTSRVMYGTSWPFLLTSAPSVASSAGLSQNASVTVTGLSPNTVYYFVPESVDASGNVQWQYGDSFRTSS